MVETSVLKTQRCVNYTTIVRACCVNEHCLRNEGPWCSWSYHACAQKTHTTTKMAAIEQLTLMMLSFLSFLSKKRQNNNHDNARRAIGGINQRYRKQAMFYRRRLLLKQRKCAKTIVHSALLMMTTFSGKNFNSPVTTRKCFRTVTLFHSLLNQLVLIFCQ